MHYMNEKLPNECSFSLDSPALYNPTYQTYPPSSPVKIIQMINARVGDLEAAGVDHTLPVRPWRPYVTPFCDIISHQYHGAGTPEDPYQVSFLPMDPEDPMQMPNSRKWLLAGIQAFACLSAALSSSAYAGELVSVTREWNPSRIVFVLGVSLFVLGFAFGPLIFGPMGEVVGRRMTYVVTFALFTAFNFAGAAAPNMPLLLAFRFLAGTFGSSVLTNAPAVIADIFDGRMRGVGTGICAAAPFLGPALGPIIGGFIGQYAKGSLAPFRWIQMFMGFFAVTLFVLGFVLIPETYAPLLLRKRAELLSKVTGRSYISSTDAHEGKVSTAEHFIKALKRPWVLLFSEPIVLFISIYMAVVYGTMYMEFAAFPIIFMQMRGWDTAHNGLAFIGILVGMILAMAFVTRVDNPRYLKIVEKHEAEFGNQTPVPPEARLFPAMVGGFLLVIGLSCFAAFCGPEYHWSAPIISSSPFGAGMVLVFLGGANYLIDAYVIYAGSTLAANSVLRCLFGAAFPLFANDMYKELGVNWASAVPAFLALACVPFPFIFYKYGPYIRSRCKYSKKAEEGLRRLRAPLVRGAEKETPPVSALPSADRSFTDLHHQQSFSQFTSSSTLKEQLGSEYSQTQKIRDHDLEMVDGESEDKLNIRIEGGDVGVYSKY